MFYTSNSYVYVLFLTVGYNRHDDDDDDDDGVVTRWWFLNGYPTIC